MKLTPVESSHIAAIGYLEDERVLLVRYKDGTLYAFLHIAPETHGYLMATAMSKGAFLQSLPAKGILITKGSAIETVQSTRAAPIAEGPLNVLDQDASKCCQKMFRSRITGPLTEGDMLACPECGTLFRPQMAGTLRSWRIVPLFAVYRRDM
jgi:hypothetical protein